jgi:hypothetical protein
MKPSQQQQQQTSSKTTTTLLGVVGFLGFAMSIPAISMWWVGSLVDRDDPLSAAAVRRGAFLNSGSRDAGLDPKWDLKTGTYKKDEAYNELFRRDDPAKVELGDEFRKRV